MNRSLNDPVVLVVIPNPYPDEVGIIVNGQHTVVHADSGRPIVTDFLEMEGRVSWVFLKQLEVFSSKTLH